jgi:transposase, IS5 family
VSLHDPDARPIVKGRLGKPVEFGYKAQVVDNSQGIVLDYEVMVGNPPDTPLLGPAVRRIKALVGRVVRKITADRGYGEASVDAELEALGVKTVVIPQGQALGGPTGGGAHPGLPQPGEVADRIRGPHQHPQARLRLGPHPLG